ncbi:MAG: monovalent cation/H+ antiporter subunit D family protein [Alphaproteobacteria bacterium]|nr:monovalent cation/H+ antiporter subunit D family protein [Alphaproteobacteria bacterium]
MVTLFSLLSLAIVLPIICALLIMFCGRYANIRDTLMVVGSFSLVIVVYLLITHYLDGYTPLITWFNIIPHVDVTFALDPLGLLFALLVSVLWLMTSVYGIGYMRANDKPGQTRFFAYIALTIASTMGVALASNLFTLFICYECITLLTYPLVTYGKKEADLKAGRLYLAMLLFPSMVFLLPSMLIIWFHVGRLDFIQGGIIGDHIDPQLTIFLVLMTMYGASKAALMPLHRWLPAAMVAPIPVSALLHAVAVVNAGVFTILKLVIYIFGYQHLQTLSHTYQELEVLTWIAIITLIAASIIALRKDDFKQMLAYSTISHLAYVVLAASLFTPKAILAGILHMVGHALAKITMFFAAGNIATTHNKTKISELTGIGLQMPLTMACFTIAAFSLVGMPLTFGMYAKWYFFQGAFENANTTVMIVLFISTMLNIAYFFPIIYRAFFKKPVNQSFVPGINESPYPMMLALTLTACLIILLFIWPDRIMQLAHLALSPGGTP